MEDDVEDEVPDEVEAPESEVVELNMLLDVEAGRIDKLVDDEPIDVRDATTESAA